MLHATVDEDGRIRLPDELTRSAQILPGQELEVVVADGVVTLFCAPPEDVETSYGEEFLEGLERALEDVRQGRTTRQDSDDEFIAALKARSKPG